MSDFADAGRVIDESVTMRIVRRCVDAVARPFHGRRFPAPKGSAYVITITAGIITHAILLQFMPDRIAPVKPLAYWMVLAFGALCVVSGFITKRSSATAIADKAAGTANTKKSSWVE